MVPSTFNEHEAPARVLALLVAAKGRVDEHELAMLDGLDAFGRLGVSRQGFVDMVRQCLDAGLCERSWLRTDDLIYVNQLLDAVRDPPLRLLVCRLCAAAITADGRISSPERLLYKHTLGYWHIQQDQVTHAILHDPMS